jgi:hypothetical protein
VVDESLNRWTFGMCVVARSKSVADAGRDRADALARSTTRRTPVADAIGRRVSVTFMDGTRVDGRLVSLSTADVVVRERRSNTAEPETDVRYPLAKVRLVETRHRKALTGMFIGLAAGAALGVVAEASCGSECRGTTVILGGIGAAAGAAAGGIADLATAPRHVVYAAASGSGQLAVAPIVGRRTAGVRLGWRW